MEQLAMRWENDGTKAKEVIAPEGCRIVTLPGLDNGIEKWLDIIQYGLSGGKENEAYYHKVMTDFPTYSPERCFFILEGDKAAATITILCDYEKKEGRVHMVACHPAFRGKGYGTLLTHIAEAALKREGMESATLTTDDWRVPAIKTYLRMGFLPDLSTDDFKARWEMIMKIING